MVESEGIFGFEAASQSQEPNIINERPVLDKVQWLLHKDLVYKPVLNEKGILNRIEIHEVPIEKRFVHPAQEYVVKDRNRPEEVGKLNTDLERQRLLEQIQAQDRMHQVKVFQTEDQVVKNETPTKRMTKAICKQIINIPHVTEVHEFPIREYHQQETTILRYMKPVVNIVREPKIVEPPYMVSQFLDTCQFIGLPSKETQTGQAAIPSKDMQVNQAPAPPSEINLEGKAEPIQFIEERLVVADAETGDNMEIDVKSLSTKDMNLIVITEDQILPEESSVMTRSTMQNKASKVKSEMNQIETSKEMKPPRVLSYDQCPKDFGSKDSQQVANERQKIPGKPIIGKMTSAEQIL